MTRLPTEQVRIGKGSVPSKGKAELGNCANASCGYLATERHHIVRRSFLAGAYDLVDIDKEPRPNIAGLCWLCHDRITKGEARIVWVDRWCWLEQGSDKPRPLSSGLGLEVSPLLESEATTQRISEAAEPPVSISSEGGNVLSRVVETREHSEPSSDSSLGPVDSSREAPGPGDFTEVWEVDTDFASRIAAARPDAGEVCPNCQRRVPHPRKESSPKDVAQLNLGKGPADSVARVKERLDDFLLLAGVEKLPYARLRALDLLLVVCSEVRAETLQNVAQELGWAS